MHLIVIIAFAALLWFNTKTPMNKLGLSAGVSAAIVLGELLIVAAAAAWTTHLTLKTLAKNPDDPNDAQCDQHHYSMILQFGLAGLFVANLILTGWPQLVRDQIGSGLTFGLVDLLVLSPFIVMLVVVWIVQYPADRAIRTLALNPKIEEGQAAHPVWSLWQYLSFNLRYQLLTVAVPMTFIIVGDDIIDHYRRPIRQATDGLFWVPDALMGIVVCAVFLLAPVMLRYIWDTTALPPNDLRTRLEAIARRTKLRYREILLWQSRGMVVNAAVMGIVPQFRYVLISDGLVESMSDRHIEAVFGHEAGHISSRHIPCFILFATLTMLIAGGLVEALRWLAKSTAWEWLTFDTIQLIVGVVVVAIWGVAFGLLSRAFEHQADIAGAESITPEPEKCDRPCMVHTPTAEQSGPLLCATAAEGFSQALRRVAALNGIPIDEKGWRHPSIQARITFLGDVSRDASCRRRFEASVRSVKITLVAGTAVGLMIAVWLFWDQLLPRAWVQ